MKIGKTAMSKAATRRQLAQLPFAEKLQILERLRDDLIIGLEKKRTANDGNNKLAAVTSTNSVFMTAVEHVAHKAPRAREVTGSDQEKKLNAEIEEIFADRKRAAVALSALFPEGVRPSSQFYERLSDLHIRLGWSDASHRAMGLLISTAMQTLSEANSENLLRELPRIRNPFFFQMLDTLPVLLGERTLRPEFAAEWFPSLVRRIGNDLAAGGFWKAVGTFCEAHPADALEILKILRSPTSEEQISVAAYILGSLRCPQLDKQASEKFRNLEAELFNATGIGARAIYHRSWLRTAWCGEVRPGDLRDLTQRMSTGNAEEREQVFWIVSRSLLSPSIPTDTREFGWNWLRSNVSSSIAPGAKYNVVDFAAQLPADKREDAANLILSVQPILSEDKGIWKRIEHFLVSTLEWDLAFFGQFLTQLTRRNAENLLKVLNEPREFEWLLSEMQTKNVGGAIAELMLLDDADSRRVGLFLFDEVDTVLLAEPFEKANQDQIAVIFYEMQRSVTHGTAVARFLIFLIPFVERADESLKQDFYDELLLQLKNFPGACKDEFAARAADFPILQKAIAEVEKYFEALGKIRESSINQIEVAGFARAARLHARRFAAQVSKGAQELSIFSKLFKNVRLLYGRQWRTFHDGVLGASSDLKTISTSMVLPRMEFVDPEGMQLRRFHASLRIRELSMAGGRRSER
jgi:hypothetical protein